MKYKILLLLLFLFCCGLQTAFSRSHKKNKVNKENTGQVSKSVFAVTPPAADYTYISSRDGHIMVYPNPASDRIYVKGDDQTPYSIELMNMIGAVVLNEQVTNGSVSLAELSPGIYIMHIRGSNGQTYLSSKLIKQ